jgi:hypothetical protein
MMGVVFNGLTTMAGFGSLVIAHHRDVWSLGLLRAGVPVYGLPERTSEPTVATRSSGSTGFRT